MPYIPQHRRRVLNDRDLFPEPRPNSVGELTYVVYREALRYVRARPISYAVLSEAVVALENAAHELRRMELDPYEDGKRAENGDVR